tara:strand:+ start:1437 stop:2915 length:1479 start_codon:yes stop_codon:yes gene_type:complete
MKYPYRQFIPEDCSLEPCVNWEIHYKTTNPFFENPITKYEDLSDEYTNLIFVNIPPWNFVTKSIDFDWSNYERVRDLVNQNKLILILDRRTEQVLLTVRIYLFDLFKKKGFNTDNIYIFDGNINFEIKDKGKCQLPLENNLTIDWAPYRYSECYLKMFDDVVPYKETQINDLTEYKKPFKYVTFNGTLHPYRAGLIAYLVQNKLDKYGLISCGSCKDQPDEVEDFIYDFFSGLNLTISQEEVKSFLSKLPLLLDKGATHSEHAHIDQAQLSHITHKDFILPKNIKRVWEKYDLSDERIVDEIDNIDEKRIVQQWFAGKDAEYRYDRTIKKFGYEPYGGSIVENTPGYINYKNSYFSIVTESPPIDFIEHDPYLDDNILSTIHKSTDKTIQSLMFHPCIFYTAPYHLKYLKELGFKTFPELFDESYDEIEDYTERMKFVTLEIHRVINMSFDELHDIYIKLLPKIKHNQIVMTTIDKEQMVLDSLKELNRDTI